MSTKETGGPKVLDWMPKNDYGVNRADASDVTPLRDWFAGHAIQSYMAAYYSKHVSPIRSSTEAEEMAQAAWMIADAMIAARAK